MRSFANAIIVLWGWRRFLAAVLAGAFSALAFAPFFAFPVLWLTVPVLVWLIDGATAGETAGFLRRLRAGRHRRLGLRLRLLPCRPVVGRRRLPGRRGGVRLADALAVVILPAGLALFWAFGVALARAFWTEGWPRVVVFAVAMALAEWLRGHLFTGFPWNAVGYALTPVPVMMQSASLVGIWGLTLAAFFIFAVPVVLVADGRGSRRADAHRARRRRGAARSPTSPSVSSALPAVPTRWSPACICASSSRTSRRTSAGRRQAPTRP